MLTCIARSKQGSDESPSVDHRNPPSDKLSSGAAPTKHIVRSLSTQVDYQSFVAYFVRLRFSPIFSNFIAIGDNWGIELSVQIKDMALKASGAYRHCAPCANQSAAPPGTTGSYSSGGDSSDLAAATEKFRWSYRRTGSSNSSSTAGRRELEARLKGISSGEGTPASASGRRIDPIVFVEESEPKEWVAQVEPGVLITFLSLPRGGNDLKRIRFRYPLSVIYSL